MHNYRYLTRRYIGWVIRLGRVKFSLLGCVLLAILALSIQILFSILISGHIEWMDLLRSIVFGLFSAPFVIYFSTQLIEKLERSRAQLAITINNLRTEISERVEIERKLSQTLDELEQEIEGRKAIQLELEQKADFLKSFIDASPDLVFYRSEDGYYLGCNRAMELVAGKSEKALLSLKPTDIFPDGARMLATDRETLDANEGMTYEQWFKYPNGRLACFELRKVPYFDRTSNTHCIMGFGRDITERLRYQETIEKNSRDKSTLMATISHELRTPLNGIIGLSRMLLDDQLDSRQQKNYLKTINVSAISLGHIFSDIIDLEKIDTRRIELHRKATDFHSLLNDVENFSSFLAEQKGLQFESHIASGLPQWLMLDYARLNQILWNVIANAVKFTAQGKVSLSVYQNESGRYCFKIQDTGIGIAPDEQIKIFAMFYQSEHSGQRPAGSGIGLAISKRLARLYGGDLNVESTLGMGATFTLEIDAETTTAPLKQQLSLPQNLRVLLVEDVAVNITVARATLQKLGYQVDVAMNGNDAIKLFEQQQYDLLLLDIQLPDMSGFDLAKMLRDKYDTGEYEYLPPLFALTANVIKNKQDYLSQGMDDVLSKPLSPHALQQSLNSYFGQSEMEISVAPKSNMIIDEPNECIDQLFLNDLCDMLGREVVRENIRLFAQTMPDYIEELNNSYQIYCQDPTQADDLASQAHKIKGACAAVGLIRLQKLAELAQNNEMEQWETHIHTWVHTLQTEWRTDCENLLRY